MIKAERDDLRKAALAARPGPFSVERRDVDCGYMTFIAHGNTGDYAWCCEDLDPKAKRNAEFIAAAHAGAVLSLLDTIDELEKQREALCTVICESAPIPWAARGDQEGAQEWEKSAHDVLNLVGYGKEPG